MRYYIIQPVYGTYSICRIGDVVRTSADSDQNYIFLGITPDVPARVRYRTDYPEEGTSQNYGTTQPSSFYNGRIVGEHELIDYNITIPANPS